MRTTFLSEMAEGKKTHLGDLIAVLGTSDISVHQYDHTRRSKQCDLDSVFRYRTFI